MDMGGKMGGRDGMKQWRITLGSGDPAVLKLIATRSLSQSQASHGLSPKGRER